MQCISYGQCDQIGQFFLVLCNNYIPTKVAQILCGLFLKHCICVKLMWLIFRQILEKYRRLFCFSIWLHCLQIRGVLLILQSQPFKPRKIDPKVLIFVVLNMANLILILLSRLITLLEIGNIFCLRITLHWTSLDAKIVILKEFNKIFFT